jgi:hypothetical protein
MIEHQHYFDNVAFPNPGVRRTGRNRYSHLEPLPDPCNALRGHANVTLSNYDPAFLFGATVSHQGGESTTEVESIR